MNPINETTELVVGKMYNVRCAAIANVSNDYVHTYVPIIGDAHKDKQFGVDFFHYHIDGRFASTDHWRYGVDELGRTNNILQSHKSENQHDYVKEIVIKRRKCRRLTTGIKPPPLSPSFNKWYDSMVGKSCKGKKCPHLGTVMHERDGKLVCPLHNLIGCNKTEIILSRQ